ncbi:MAG: methyltransferase domain-containing protein, partial [Gemmatimonadota bacterium]|nr:methyltransferase domain-containing protein [Gemmatimonadota bacterium]
MALPDNPDQDPMLDWREVFDNDQPVEIEIGIGKGRFIIDAASRQPTVNFVGIEWAAKYLRIARQRAARRNLGNVRFAHLDAREFVEFFVATASVRAYHI